MPKIEEIRRAVADALSEKGHGNRQFLDDIREGRRDDCPFMTGALAWAAKGDQFRIAADHISPD